MLRQVLQELEAAKGPVSLDDLGRRLGVERSVLEGMIQAFPVGIHGKAGFSMANLAQQPPCARLCPPFGGKNRGLPQDLYQAILARRSVRRYDKEPLSATTLATIRQIIVEARPLVPENRFEVAVRDDVVRRDLVALLGAYGRLITPPHALVPSMAGESHVLEDLGYRVEQIVVRMTALGIGTCYIGTLADEDKARATLGLPGQVRIGALVAFGQPAMAPGGRAINTLIRSALGRNARPDLARFFFQETFDNPTDPPEHLLPLIEAVACAPSACNAQPWRLLWRDGRLTLFVTRNNPKYGDGAKETYCLYDAGIAMANISLAMEALGMSGQWLPLEAADPTIPVHPANLYSIARLNLDKAS